MHWDLKWQHAQLIHWVQELKQNLLVLLKFTLQSLATSCGEVILFISHRKLYENIFKHFNLKDHMVSVDHCNHN